MAEFLHPLSLSLLLLPFFFFFFFFPMAAQSYPHCPSFICDGFNISYPFWMMDNQNTTQFCGYKGFGINCNQQDQPIITLGGESYYVRDILHESKSIILTDYDALIDCPRVRHGINLQTLPFYFSTSNINLSFHFNCTGIPSFASPISCFDYGTRKSCFNIMSPKTDNFDWDAYRCEDDVVTTVFIEEAHHTSLGLELSAALKRGFELVWWRVDDCVKCEESNGRCGHNSSTTEFMCFCSDGRTTTGDCNKGLKINLRLKLVIGVGSALLVLLLICTICCIIKFSPSFKHRTEDDRSVEAFVIQYGSLTTKRYNYVDIKKMTNSFQVKLGQGGFGSVFKGKLSDGRLVAVKVLNSSRASGREFINEVASIGRTSHVNIVALLGFCSDNQKRALIYEFMPNGSLEKFIYSRVSLRTSVHIGVIKLHEVALGIARGLDYLHRGCNTRILHLDIKPHNILLDEDFCPKIADFGLAKLYSRKDSIISMLEARGTIGYIAPEVFNRSFGGVSHKSDVYSYGMLILEMVGGRKNVDAGVGSGHTSEIYFPYWIYNHLEKDDYLLDSISSVEENDYARKMTIVGLWCIQTAPSQRPSIDEVIEMLEGSTEALEVPPKPFFCSPPRSPATTFSTSQSEPEITVIKQ